MEAFEGSGMLRDALGALEPLEPLTYINFTNKPSQNVENTNYSFEKQAKTLKIPIILMKSKLKPWKKQLFQ